jgi:tetratricopeptide (TPR) repeat protein
MERKSPQLMTRSVLPPGFRLAAAARRWYCLLMAAPLVAGAAAGASPAAGGWQQLWSNKNAAARASFRAALKQDPADLEALQGLGLVEYQEESAAAALQTWRSLYRVASHRASAADNRWMEADWPRVVELAQETGQWALLEGAARDVLAARGAPVPLRASARLALAEIAYRAGRPAAAEPQWAALGYVREWRVIGPFDNVSLSGFDKEFPPEREIDFSKSYPGKDDQALAWHPLKTVFRDGQCEVAASLGDDGANLFYAATTLASPKEQPVCFRFDPTGASKIYLNGQLLFSDDVYRQHQPLVADPLAVTATLSQGWNHLLIKLADSENSGAAFALRVTTPGGTDGLRLPADPARLGALGFRAKGRKGEEFTGMDRMNRMTEWGVLSRYPVDPVDPCEFPSVPFRASTPGTRNAGGRFPARDLSVGPLLELAEIDAAADRLRRERDYSAAIELLKKAIAGAPSSGWLHWELSQTLREDEQADEARAERDLARKQNPRLVAAELDYLEDKEHALPAGERIQQLKALRKISPESGEVAWELAQAYDNAGLKSEALKSARAAVASAGGPEAIARLAVLYQDEEREALAKSTVAQALRTAPNDETLLTEQARLMEESGKTAAIAPYQRLAQVHPSLWWYRLQLAELYQAAGKLPLAAQTLKAARDLRPQDAHVCALLADVLREMGRSADAIQLYRTAIRLAPSQVGLREKLQLVSGERPVVDLAPATPSGPILAKTPKAADMPGASSVVLLDETREVVYPDYARASRVHRIVKVFDAAAVEQYKEFPLTTDTASASATVESARLIKPDGKVQDFTETAAGGAVALPSLAPGDVIDVAYRVEDYPRGGLARQFWTEWYFSEPATAVKLSRYVLITPPAMQFEKRRHGPVPEPAVKDVKGWRVREWRMADLPARKMEPASPGVADTESWLDLSTIRSWKQVVQWYQDLSRPRCVPDAAIRAKAAELTRDAKTEEEKLRALAAFVARDIQYQSTPFRMSAYVPTEGKQVIRERYGDCKDKAALLTALLSAVGIKANMVLLSGRSQGVTPFLPSPRFNHAIAVVQTEHGPLWVDATADQLEFGSFPSEDQQVPALVIDDATTDLVLTPDFPVEKDRVVDSSTLALGEDERLSGRFQISATGSWGWILRSLLRRVPEGSRDQALRGIASRITENCRYESGSLEHLSDPDQPLTLGIQYHVDRYSSEAGSFLLVRLPWGMRTNSADDLLTDAKREQDLEAGTMRGDYLSSVQLELPPGYTPQDLQPEAKGESPWGSYRITYRMDGRVLHAESELKLTPLRVAAKDVGSFLEFLRAVDKEAHRQLVLKKQ